MKNTKTGLLLFDALCAGIFSWGAALVLLPAFGFPEAPGFCFGSVLLGLGICALWEWKPWLIPSLLGVCGILLLAAMGAVEELRELVPQTVRGAWEESLGGTPVFPVFFVCVLPITALFWLIMRKIPSLWLTTLLGAGLIGYKAVFLPEGWLLPFLLLMAGEILFLPRASRKGEGRLQAQLLAAALAVPVLGLTLLLGPRTDGAWRSAAVGHLVQDAQDFWEYHWGGLPAIPVTSMRSMGLQPQKDRLGGDVDPSDTPVLTGSQRLLLRGQALEVYTGSGWEDDSQWNGGNFRYESLFWRGRRGEAFGLTVPKEGSVPLLDELLADVDADLRSLRSFRSLFLPYRPEDIAVARGGNELYFNMQGEAYWQRPPQSSVEYHVKGRTWDFRDPDFDRNMLLLEKALSGWEADKAYARAEDRCLNLPDTLPGWVGELAETLTAGASSSYAKAVSLRDYLEETCEYTLAPGPADPDTDFVAAFLTEKKGYCTYYASALTVLCRCAGIPARYVTGYGMREAGKRYQATGATAHAWTEIYLENIGWVPLDALSQDIFQQEAPLPEESHGAAGPQAVPSPTPDVSEGILTEGPEAGRFNPTVLLWAVPPALLFVFLAAGKLLRRRRYSLPYIKRKYPETGRAAEHCCAGLLSLLRMGRLAPRPGETPLAFWQRAAEQKNVPGLRETGRVMDRLRFGETPPTWEEIAGMCAACEALREQLGTWRRFWL